MSNLMLIEKLAEGERTPAQAEALMMHQQLHMHKGMIAVGLAGMCQDLKIIRDKKLYVELGYSDFTNYTEQEHGIKERQAYKYIRAIEQYGFQFLHSSANADIGVTKLLEIAVLSGEDRSRVFDEHTSEELSAMSTPEVKALVEEIANLKKQLSFFDNQEQEKPLPSTVEQKPFDEIEEEIRAEVEESVRAEYEEKIEKLKEQAVSDEELKKYKTEAEKEAKLKAAAELKELKEKIKSAEAKAKAEAEKLKAEEAKTKKLAEEAAQAKEVAADAVRLKAQLDAANERTASMERQIKVSANPELTRFKYVFEDAKISIKELVEQYAKLDEGIKPKMKAAIEALIGGINL